MDWSFLLVVFLLSNSVSHARVARPMRFNLQQAGEKRHRAGKIKLYSQKMTKQAQAREAQLTLEDLLGSTGGDEDDDDDFTLDLGDGSLEFGDNNIDNSNEDNDDDLDDNSIEDEDNDNLDEDMLDENCQEMVIFEEYTEYEETLDCEHVEEQSCFDSFVTTFKSGKGEECSESFQKKCEVQYNKVPRNEKVQVCIERPQKDCDIQGDIVCQDSYETICETVLMENEVEEDIPDCKEVLEEICNEAEDGDLVCNSVPRQQCDLKKQTSTKVTPKTECKQVKTEVCGPEMCPLLQGGMVCEDRIKTVLLSVPSESCNLVPMKHCSEVTKVIPLLEAVKHCIQVPKEVCSKAKVNPVRVKRPVKKIWCED